MEKLIVKGGNPLKGEIKIGGAKNAAVALLPATILTSGTCTITNLPQISDIDILEHLLKEMGSSVKREGTSITVCNDEISYKTHNFDEAGKMRASYYLVGALLGKYKKAEIPLPGGCNLGTRQIDQHIKGFEKLGAKVEIKHGLLRVTADRLIGTTICFDVVTVGATINVMLAAVMAEGVTKLENVAKEPHVVDVANLLIKAGAKIEGAGTDAITITGVKELKAVDHAVIPDQIETGTYMIAAAATRGDVILKDVCEEHMQAVIEKLREANVTIEMLDSTRMRVKGNEEIKAVNVKTLPHPGFPTDLQSPMGALLAIASGTSMVTESIWENRFKYTDELKKMGSDIAVDGRVAIIRGVKTLSGSRVVSPDLRGGAALIIAGLVAEGKTIVLGMEHVNRGYEGIEDKLKSLGADIELVKEDANEN